MPRVARELGTAAVAAGPIVFEALRYRETRSVAMVVLSDEDGSATAFAGDLAGRLERHGRTMADIDVAARIDATAVGLADPDAYIDGLGQLAKLGVTWTHAPVVRGNIAATLDAVAQFGEQVRARL